MVQKYLNSFTFNNRLEDYEDFKIETQERIAALEKINNLRFNPSLTEVSKRDIFLSGLSNTIGINSDIIVPKTELILPKSGLFVTKSELILPKNELLLPKNEIILPKGAIIQKQELGPSSSQEFYALSTTVSLPFITQTHWHISFVNLPRDI